MLNAVILDEREQEYVVRAIETSLQVTRKHQLFLWTQGLFHGLVPHDILVALQFDENGKTIHLECITSNLLEGEVYQRICDPNLGLAVRIARHSQTNDVRLPLMLPESGIPSAQEKRVLTEMDQCGLHSTLVHGRQSTRGGGWDYFVLLRKESAIGVRHGYFLELLLPHLHSAFHRVMLLDGDFRTNESQDTVNKGSKVLTDRELEIMHWVREGKSNQEIGAILSISQLTVKNHVQNILKKLKVQNRAQAVSHAIALRLISRAH